MARRARVDAELVRRGLARSRQQAAELIGAGKVRIDGLPAVKPATAVSDTTALTVVTDSERAWVSRGAHKLVGALEAFAIAVAGRRCLDAGASTGGFTEVLLDRGAAHVVAAENQFRKRVPDFFRIPYDPHLATGLAVDFSSLKRRTRNAVLDLAGGLAQHYPASRVRPRGEDSWKTWIETMRQVG